jgi:hypothetical protein
MEVICIKSCLSTSNYYGKCYKNEIYDSHICGATLNIYIDGESIGLFNMNNFKLFDNEYKAKMRDLRIDSLFED